MSPPLLSMCVGICGLLLVDYCEIIMFIMDIFSFSFLSSTLPYNKLQLLLQITVITMQAQIGPTTHTFHVSANLQHSLTSFLGQYRINELHIKVL